MYIAFLRSINVGKTNKISMQELISIFEMLGYKHVKTYLNTGNVIFESDNNDVSELEKSIRKGIYDKCKLDIETIVRKKEHIRKMLSDYKFESIDSKNRYITILKDNIDDNHISNLIEQIESYKKSDDQYELVEKAINLYIPSGYGKTKLNNKFIEKKSEKIATTRNLNTLEKILKLMSQ